MLKKKTVENEQVIYFEYAPPYPDDSADSPGNLKAPFRGAPGYKGSVYYYWYEFLKLNPRYKSHCQFKDQYELEPIYQDFKNIHKMDFITWWMHHGRALFAEPAEGSIILDPSEVLRNQGYLFLGVPADLNVDRALFELKAILTSRLENNSAQPFKSQARYPIYSRPNISALHKALAAAMGLSEQGNENLSLAILAQLTAKKMRELENSKNAPIDISITAIHTIKNNVLNMIENTAFGLFPKDDVLGSEKEADKAKIIAWEERRKSQFRV